MNCPFLKEARVKYCEKSAVRKMIRVAGEIVQETCATPRYQQCAVYPRQAEDAQLERCPYLRESLAQYCATAASPRFIPYSEPAASRCGTDAHRYCDVYLETVSRAGAVGGICLPGRLCYSTNHMWLDAAPGGSCHIGVDAFLTRVVGSVDGVTFLRQTGIQRPSVVLTMRGVDLEVCFPHPVSLTASNRYLRANPAKLTADPYGMGWLFQGTQPVASTGLISGAGIGPWIEREIGRMSEFLAECRVMGPGGARMNDGGVFAAGVLRQLNHEEIRRLFHEFFGGFGE